MSTFNGIMSEFPLLRVDFFRNQPSQPPPLACFLSHVHSDHLAGLETFRSPFVYCSAATKELLLKLERFPCRINLAKGILEASIQTYKHLKNLLKPLPLETPVMLELAPGNNIQVTLFDANHCPGAVMFLFEGGGKAVLYTGDLRCEAWFVNALTRSPSMVEYSYGIKTLDTIYLDTSFTEDIAFQTKGEGIQELLLKVSKYPPETVFHFQAWTYGYEDVWIALSKFLQSRVHVDKYKWRVYASLVAKDSKNKFGAQFHMTQEAPALIGFMCGNTQHEGCLTQDENVRLHSCEKGDYCKRVQDGPVVWIQPIIAHLPSGEDILELGIGGGGDDFKREAELDYFSAGYIKDFLDLMSEMDEIPDMLKESIRGFVFEAVKNGRNASLNLDISAFGEKNETMLANAIQGIAGKVQRQQDARLAREVEGTEELPKMIRFPYSRHASYPELCHLVSALRPRDVWPCTENLTEWIKNDVSIKDLFGQHCSGTSFQYDKILDAARETLELSQSQSQHDTQNTNLSFDIPERIGLVDEGDEGAPVTKKTVPSEPLQRDQLPPNTIAGSEASPESDTEQISATVLGKRDFAAYGSDVDELFSYEDVTNDISDSQASDVSEHALRVRLASFEAMLGNIKNRHWQGIGLISTSDHHTQEEIDLGLR